MVAVNSPIDAHDRTRTLTRVLCDFTAILADFVRAGREVGGERIMDFRGKSWVAPQFFLLPLETFA
jgi:hypothetical protein